MATETKQQQLEGVQAAITEILTTGQSTDVNGRTRTSADLRVLLEERKRLERDIAREARGGIRVRRGVRID